MARPSPLGGATEPFVLLEDRLAGAGTARLFRDPVEIVRCEEPDAVGDAFAAIEAGLAAGLHAAVLFSYELGHVLEPRLRPHLPARRETPLVWAGLFPPPRHLTGAEADALFAACGPPPPITQVALGHDRARHVAAVEQVLARIAAGDIYQANLTFPVRFRYAGDPLALYAALRARQPVAHGGVVAMGDRTLLSVSPELFVAVRGDRAEARPMKGTAPRGTDADGDARARAGLAADAKQRAENLMIVDLLRNDLARISAPGSVAVPALFTVETYPTFHALTSTITARLLARTTLAERVAALFPCGSVVGAPKIRAGEIIARIEEEPRGAYTGAIGAIEPGGAFSLNVAIRTAVIDAGGSGRYGVGGGIVADSDPAGEHDEALLKARVLTGLAEDYLLIETLRWSPAAGFALLDGHLARLVRSAAALGFACDRSAVRARLEAAASGEDDLRVRLTLARDGAIVVSATPAGAQPARPRLAIARQRLDAGDPFLRHKTTRRDLHEAAFAEAARAGCDEALLLNRRGGVADGARSTVLAEIDGRLVTPRVEDGALPGVLRAALLAEGRAVARPLTRAMLARATRILVASSLRGLREAVLEPERGTDDIPASDRSRAGQDAIENNSHLD